jgi:hypothetical protein
VALYLAWGYSIGVRGWELVAVGAVVAGAFDLGIRRRNRDRAGRGSLSGFVAARWGARRRRSPSWLEPVCQICRTWKLDGGTVRGAFEAAAPDLSDRDRFESLVAARLRHDAELIADWQIYSGDKRTSRGPFLAGLTVGSLDRDPEVGLSVTDRRIHGTEAEACADFLLREAEQVLAPHAGDQPLIP